MSEYDLSYYTGRADLEREIRELRSAIEVKERILMSAAKLASNRLRDLETLTRDLRNMRHKLAAKEDQKKRMDGGLNKDVADTFHLPSTLSNNLNFR